MENRKQSIEKDSSVISPKKNILDFNSNNANSKIGQGGNSELKEISTNISYAQNQAINVSKNKSASKNKKDNTKSPAIQSKLPRKKVKFKQVGFLEVVDIESWKKHNANNVFQEPGEKTHCKCSIL